MSNSVGDQEDSTTSIGFSEMTFKRLETLTTRCRMALSSTGEKYVSQLSQQNCREGHLQISERTDATWGGSTWRVCATLFRHRTGKYPFEWHYWKSPRWWILQPLLLQTRFSYVIVVTDVTRKARFCPPCFLLSLEDAVPGLAAGNLPPRRTRWWLICTG